MLITLADKPKLIIIINWKFYEFPLDELPHDLHESPINSISFIACYEMLISLLSELIK